ncbi:hypothetical protein [Kribbella italica]|uniref:Uncharacterized protein n=1 Tax=Kribbella italica TaxID=1540520 RepID=A0A7W9J8Z0_9ACTN|nr:hypothetical protein [Kribbella italica]MBB5837802.1 hypothetical protein [Kribbella italica]
MAIVDTSPLGQGDIIRRTSRTDDIWDQVAVIVTADCDIARDKHAGRLSCVPLIPVSSYLAISFLPKRISRIEIAIYEKLLAIMRQNQIALLGPDAVAISPKRAKHWLLSTEPLAICRRLAIPDEQVESFVALADQAKRLTASADQSFDDQVARICESEHALGRGESAKLRTRLSNDIAAHLRDLPGDALFLRHQTSDGSDTGYIAYLRIIREIRDERVAIKASQMSYEITHERWARLSPPYIYALTQRLGNVFSAIGLPEEYEASRDECGSLLIGNTDAS